NAVVLIVEDDLTYAKLLLDVAHEKAFKGVIARSGAAALSMLREFKPAAITLDIRLPDLDGWKLLDRLKVDLSTRHIPVQVITAGDTQAPRWQGAIGVLKKTEPREALERAFDQLRDLAQRPVRSLLVVEGDESRMASIRELIGNGDVETTVVRTGGDALAALQSQKFDCVVLNPGVEDMPGDELLERLKDHEVTRPLPVVVYTPDQSEGGDRARHRFGESLFVTDVRSPERLLDETALPLHRGRQPAPGTAAQDARVVPPERARRKEGSARR
ncbi:MAG TPA: response regulator, partial [Verrucomicrobiota bacterium]|nr:response regulator [Verrucomicrobiota bacterium]